MFYKNKCNNVSANLLNVLMASQEFTTYTTYQKFGVSKIFFFFLMFLKSIFMLNQDCIYMIKHTVKL